MEKLLSYADPVAGFIGFGFLYLLALLIFLGFKTKKGRKILGLED